MAIEEIKGGLKDRLDDFFKLAGSGQTVELEIKLHRDIVKQVSQAESTDDINIETDMSLLMADFKTAQGITGGPEMVSKVYAIGPVNENDIDDKTTRHVANQRLRMDFARLKEANVKFEAVSF
jgi:hypothetical protein